MEGIKNRIVTAEHVSMTFCANCKNCPSVVLDANEDAVIVGGDEEGYTEFTKEQFKLFIKEAKEGTFDELLKDVDESATRTGGLSPDCGPSI